MRGVWSVAVAVALAAGTISASWDASAEEKRVRWKMHSAWSSKLSVLGDGGKRIEHAIERMTQGSFQLKFYEPGALVPGIAYFDPVAAGSVDVGYGTSGYGVGKVPALAFFTAVPFGPGFGEYHGWMRFGGGQQLYDEMSASIGVKGVVCATLPPEASGWFRKEINTVEDLKGLKMRFFGLGAKVMEKFGVSTQLLAGGDIYPALELGSIDGTEFSMPSIDEGLGFFQVAKHYYFPGWHQPVSFNELLFNKPKYDGLSDYHKDALGYMCGWQIYTGYTEADAIQGPAMKRMQEKGVALHRWSPEMMKAFEAAWQEVANEEAAKDPMFKKAWDSLNAWRAVYKVWRDRGYIE